MNRDELADLLEARAGDLRRARVVSGFDGFVDEMISVVDRRSSLEEFDRVDTISRFAELAAGAAGQSSLREIVVTATHPGGCAVNLADGLAALGVGVDVFATLGEPVHPAFGSIGESARLHSWGREPGRTLAFEFRDGKLMYSHVSHLAEFTPEHVDRALADGVYQKCCHEAQLIALTDWAMYPHMTAVWRLLRERVFAELPKHPPVLVDLVDPSSPQRSRRAGDA